MDRYIGLDAHASSCTVATVGPSGRLLYSQVVETNARALIQVLRSIPRDRHLCLEEGTHASWLYEVLSPHVEETVVAATQRGEWLCKLPPVVCPLPELLLPEHDGLLDLRRRAQKEMLAEAHKHRVYGIVKFARAWVRSGPPNCCPWL